jgi:hypothetical protein
MIIKQLLSRTLTKNRLGTSEETNMHFQLHDIIESHDLLLQDNPFTNGEIKYIPTDKALG